ncbi:MAG TPA: response regulator, partial [Myxococcaceae bacterium]|nr:response regulator [Myxococcaceae bacterium]
GGITGAALATALLQGARARGRTLEVRVFEGAREEGSSIAPLVLTPECRSRLAGLGCRILPEWRTLELGAIEIISGHRRELFPAPPSGLWVVDGWPAGDGGRRIIATALSATASLHGARFVTRKVDQVERQPASAPNVRSARTGSGPLVVRAQGVGECFHAVALAGGSATGLGDRFFEGYKAPSTLPAAHARLRYNGFRPIGPQTARVILSPLPGVDMLYLLPCASSIYALALGPTATPADLCQAVMAAARDGHLPEGFEMCNLSTTRVPFGAGKKLAMPGRLAVGTAAFGHPLQLGISDAIASVTRAAAAMLDDGPVGTSLERRYVRDGISEMVTDAANAAKAVRWLRHAGDKAAGAFAQARARNRWAVPFTGGVLGLPSPTPGALLASARWAGISQTMRNVFLSAVEPLPPSAPELERDLYYVVDDDPEAREALAQFLESQGAKVVSFADELALYCAVARRPPTAILLDVVLNWVDGLRLCEGLKQHPLTRGSRVFVMSGLNRPHVKARALEAGAEAFLPKPLDPQMLLQVLTQHRVRIDQPQRPEQPEHREGPPPAQDGEAERVAL